MASQVEISRELWQKIIQKITALAPAKSPTPIVFALYGEESDHLNIIDYRHIEKVKETSTGYSYPGIKKLGFYPPRGTGKWFSGTLVVGIGFEFDNSITSGSDRYWMIRDKMDFRIMMDRPSPHAAWEQKVYILEINERELKLK